MVTEVDDRGDASSRRIALRPRRPRRRLRRDGRALRPQRRGGKMPAGAVEFVRALRDHDLDRLRAVVPDDFVFHDHRRTGAGRLGSADDYVALLAALFEQSPDVLIEACTSSRGSPRLLDVGHLIGSARAASSSPSTRASCWTRTTDLSARSCSRSRTSTSRGRASRSCDRIRCAFRPTPRRGCAIASRRPSTLATGPRCARSRAPTSGFEDRGKRALVTGGVEMWIAS